MRKKQKEKRQESLLNEIPQKKESKKINKAKFALILILLFVSAYTTITVYQIYDLKKQEKLLMEKQSQLKSEKERLQKELGRVNSPEYIEQIARNTLRMIKQGEILYVIPGTEKNNAASSGSIKTGGS